MNTDLRSFLILLAITTVIATALIVAFGAIVAVILTRIG